MYAHGKIAEHFMQHITWFWTGGVADTILSEMSPLHNRRTERNDEAVTGLGTASYTHTAQRQAFPNLAESAKPRTRTSVTGMLERVNKGIVAEGRHRTQFYWK